MHAETQKDRHQACVSLEATQVGELVLPKIYITLGYNQVSASDTGPKNMLSNITEIDRS